MSWTAKTELKLLSIYKFLWQALIPCQMTLWEFKNESLPVEVFKQDFVSRSILSFTDSREKSKALWTSLRGVPASSAWCHLRCAGGALMALSVSLVQTFNNPVPSTEPWEAPLATDVHQGSQPLATALTELTPVPGGSLQAFLTHGSPRAPSINIQDHMFLHLWNITKLFALTSLWESGTGAS